MSAGQVQSRTAGRVVAELARVGTVAQPLVDHLLPQMGGAFPKARDSVDHVHHEVEAVEVVQHHHVERCGRRALLLVTAYMEVAMVGAADT